jgi:hypothetical protein
MNLGKDSRTGDAAGRMGELRDRTLRAKLGSQSVPDHKTAGAVASSPCPNLASYRCTSYCSPCFRASGDPSWWQRAQRHRGPPQTPAPRRLGSAVGWTGDTRRGLALQRLASEFCPADGVAPAPQPRSSMSRPSSPSISPRQPRPISCPSSATRATPSQQTAPLERRLSSSWSSLRGCGCNSRAPIRTRQSR